MTVVVDTSAAIAILTGEADADALMRALAEADSPSMSAATLVELGIVLEARFGTAGAGVLERFLRDAGIEVVAVDREIADLAIEAWRRFGKGRHPAALHFGDCFTYALAIAADAAILCTGEDFAKSDAKVALG
jgi:ribonuclease VapC